MPDQPASSLVYPERAVAPPDVLPTPWAASVLQDSVLQINLPLTSSGLCGLLQAAPVFGSDAFSGTSPLHCGGL